MWRRRSSLSTTGSPSRGQRGVCMPGPGLRGGSNEQNQLQDSLHTPPHALCASYLGGGEISPPPVPSLWHVFPLASLNRHHLTTSLCAKGDKWKHRILEEGEAREGSA